ncbi:hypothetical protein ACLF6K_06730 [Streptomyces xanthophaeus]|uniref:hypothetical protein n=1 Tax=Streptomyces xanthophaeus TaxID=67385 RepID=UPI0039902D47
MKFRIKCCLCRKTVPPSQDAYALDEEWQRRFPDMYGTIACWTCAMGTYWTCTQEDGTFVEGHVAALAAPDIDAFNHVITWGTHVAMVLAYPRSGMLQGAEAYLRHKAEWMSTQREVARELRAVIAAWDEEARSAV